MAPKSPSATNQSGNKRRSWTGRLKDRFRPASSMSQHHQVELYESPDDWGWTGPHPQLHEGHHAPSVPSLQGSVFVAANFVYDYRQKYSPAASWMNGGSSATANSHRQQQQEPKSAEFRAEDVNHNIRLKLQRLQESRRLAAAAAAQLQQRQDSSSSSSDDEEESRHPQTTVAIDRPGLMVSGQRICILTGQTADPSSVTVSGSTPVAAISQERVRLKVEFQRNCPLRRSLSDRVAPPMAVAASFHDTTRLTQKTRSRGSLHDLFDTENQLPVGGTGRRISRPTEPPPPPPETPPIAPPRRIKRGSPTTPIGRPLLTGQMVSWTAWSGQDPPAPQEEESKRKGLWPSITSIGKSLINSSPPPVETAPEEHIYEEIGDVKPLVVVEGGLFSRSSRAGSFAGASRQDILRYLDELRRKHPTGVISAAEVTSTVQGRKSPQMSSLLPQMILHNPPSPSSPVAGGGDEDDNDIDDMGALLLAMRHNAPNRHSNRSSQSSTTSSQDSAPTPTPHQVKYRAKGKVKALINYFFCIPIRREVRLNVTIRVWDPRLQARLSD